MGVRRKRFVLDKRVERDQRQDHRQCYQAEQE